MENLFINKLKLKLIKKGADFFKNNFEFLGKNKKLKNENEYKDLENLIINNIKINKNTVFLSDVSNELKIIFNKMFDRLKEDEESMRILELLRKISLEYYIVGGANRNALASLPIKDYDFVTDASLERIEELFKKEGYKIDLIGKHFSVIMVYKNGRSWEIANFRREIGCNGNGVTNVEIGTFDDDWKRRDFRFNAIYTNPIFYELKDPTFNGVIDALNKEIYFIGDPDERIDEDVVRILRVYKFYKEGFKIPKKTLSVIRRNFHKLCKANIERIREHIEYLAFFDERIKNENSND